MANIYWSTKVYFYI